MRLAIGSDHVGLSLKKYLIQYLTQQGPTLTDVGAYSQERTDYPLYGYKAAQLVVSGQADYGVLI